MIRKSLFILLSILIITPSVSAKDLCTPQDRPCIIEQILQETAKIDNKSWKDQTYREVAKTLAAHGNTDKALSLIDLIKTPDTKALTIRGIGMNAAELNLPTEKRTALFAALREKSEAITHAPSYGIALTYIAMAQAVAGDNLAAHQTALEMKNESLRNKAFGETAEIQAQKGELKFVNTSITAITSESFRNKAYTLTSKIFADSGDQTESLMLANSITNPYKKAAALQYILNAPDKIRAEKTDP